MRVRAPPPNKTTETHATVRNAIRAQVGEESADMARLLTIDFELDAINAASAAFPRATFAWSYCHLGQPVYRKEQKLDVQGK